MEKAGLIGLVRMRYIESDENLSMRGEALAKALQCDREDGLVPFFVSCLYVLESTLKRNAGCIITRTIPAAAVK